MARSAEKKMTALARWRAVHEDRISYRERPKLASECTILKDANSFRRTIINETTKKIAQIQNSSLGEFKLRDLNDEINRLIRERKHWEDRILELGGIDYKLTTALMLESGGKSLSGINGYKYFGAARDLPGVRELFRNDAAVVIKKPRMDLPMDYYGFNEEDDGVVLEQLEEEEEDRRQLLRDWKQKKLEERKALADIRRAAGELLGTKKHRTRDKGKENKQCSSDIPATVSEIGHDSNVGDEEGDEYQTLEDFSFPTIGNSVPVADQDIDGTCTELEARVKRFRHIAVPSKAEVDRAVLDLKKQKIMRTYMSDELMQSVVTSGTLLGAVNVGEETTEVGEETTEVEEETTEVEENEKMGITEDVVQDDEKIS